MKITVCFKIVTDYDAVPSSGWNLFPTGKPSLSLAKKSVGVFDEGALETALVLAEEIRGAGGEVTLQALTYGRCGGVFTEALYSAGYDRVVSIRGFNTDFSPDMTASVLAERIRKDGADLVLCGEMTGPGDTGTVPYRIAEKLGMKVLDGVSVMGFSAEDGVTAARETQDSREYYCGLSSVVAVISSAEHPNLRMALYKDKVAAKGRKAENAHAFPSGKRTPVSLRKPWSSGKRAKAIEGTVKEKASAMAQFIRSAEEET